jgi:hypothetical protein
MILRKKPLRLCLPRNKFCLPTLAYKFGTGSLRGAEGDVAISIAELSRRFGIDESVLRNAENDLKSKDQNVK